MAFNNKTYDILKYIALIALPAIEAFWLTIGKVWGFPYVIEIGATIAAVDVLLGSLLGVSTKNYNKPAEVDVTGLVYLEDGDENEDGEENE